MSQRHPVKKPISNKYNKTGKLISINALEYGTVLVNYAASTHCWVKIFFFNLNREPLSSGPY